MLKFLYKTLLISLISGSLTTMSQPVYAQAQMTKAESSGLSRDSNGVLKKTENHNLQGAESADMLSSITMLAAGTIAGRMAMSYRPITTDVMIAAAGGIAFIAGEVISNVKYKNTMEAMTVEVVKSSDGKSDQAQIERLQDLKKSYEEAKDTTSTKKTLQLAAAAAFAAAAATSVYLAFQEDAMDAACQGAITTAKTGLAACISAGATGVGATEAASCTACQGELTAYQTTYFTKDAKDKVPAPSRIKESTGKAVEVYLSSGACLASATTGATVKGIATAVNSACQAALSFKLLQQTSTQNPVIKSSTSSEQMINMILFGGTRSVASYEMYQSRESSSFFDHALDLVMPRAHAGWMPMLGLGAGALGSYFLITGTLGTYIDTQMYVPMNRAIAFGVLGGLSYMASQASQGQMDKIDENIKKIDQILTELGALQKGIKSNNVNDQQIKLAGFKANQDQEIKLNSNASVKTECATSAASSNCTTLGDTIKNLPGFSDLPDSFKSIASQSAKLGDGLSGASSISGSTLATAASLAGKQNAISNLLKRTQTKLNDQLAANGKGKIDFDKEQRNLLNKLNAQTGKVLKSKGATPGGFLSSIGGTPLSGSSTLGASTPSSAPLKKPLAYGMGGVAPVPSAKDKAFDLDFKEAGGEFVEGQFAEGGASAATEEKFDIGTNDINTDSGESIFQVISNRYIKSGYPKLLEEIPLKK